MTHGGCRGIADPDLRLRGKLNKGHAGRLTTTPSESAGEASPGCRGVRVSGTDTATARSEACARWRQHAGTGGHQLRHYHAILRGGMRACRGENL